MKNIPPLSFLILTCSLISAEIEVSFPAPTREEQKFQFPFVEQPKAEKAYKPVTKDGLLLYYSGSSFGEIVRQKHPAQTFDEVIEGMTLREIVSLLGPGLQNQLEGIGFIYWLCEDGRTLAVWPTTEMDKEARYHINQREESQRLVDVRQLTTRLIGKLKISDEAVEVTFTEDTHQAKAGQTQTYTVGQVFQKTDPLPRIDFRITEIKTNSIHCDYFYQAPNEGLLRYQEIGKIILSPTTVSRN